MKKSIIVLLVAIAFQYSTKAQTEEKNVGSVEINVVDQYKASIKEPSKITDQPGFADTTTKKLPVNYGINPELLRFSFSPKPIQPVKVSGVRLQKLPKNMVRLGAGNYTSALAEVVLSNSRSQTFNWDVALRHFSSQNGVKEIAYDKSPFMENELRLGGKWLLRDFRLRAGVGADFNSFSYYGIPDGTNEALFPKDLQKNAYQRYFGTVELERVFQKSLQIFQKAGINYQYFTNNWNTSEHLLTLGTDWIYPKKVEDHIIGAALNANWLSANIGTIATESSQLNVQFFPKAIGKLNWFNYTLGLNFNFYNTTTNLNAIGQNNFSMYFFPEIAIQAELARNVLSVFAGWTGNVTMNGLHSLTEQNPYFAPTAALTPAREVLTPTATNRLYGGLEGAVAKNISYKAEIGFNSVKNLALFYRSGDSLTIPVNNVNLPAFSVLYVKGQYADIRGELTYSHKSTEVSGYAQFYNYTLQTGKDVDLKNPAHLPALKVGVDVSQKLKSKFDVRAGLAVVTGRKALENDGKIYVADMKNIWDARLDIGYNINNNLSAGLHFANLASQQYDLWLGYPAQRLRVMLSLMYKF